MPYKTFTKWAFDGKIETPIPNKEVLLKYNSPITHNYLLNIFVKKNTECVGGSLFGYKKFPPIRRCSKRNRRND